MAYEEPNEFSDAIIKGWLQRNVMNEEAGVPRIALNRIQEKAILKRLEQLTERLSSIEKANRET